MSANASIEVRNLSLVVPYYAQPERISSSWLGTLVGAATSVPRRRFATLLDQVSFNIGEGERVALIGRNGAGKSTLLRVLAGAFEPTSGSITVNGSRQALLSIGLGFNAEATIMENIFLRATAMGVPSRDIQGLVKPVLEFSGLAAVANRRLLTLSSGQRMRLGFAISTAIPTDIMLLDEWFGAGDAQFLRRARQRMMDRMEGSRIVVVASHNDSLLRKLCDRALLLDGGKLVFDGGVGEALAEYRRRNQAEETEEEIARRKAARKAKIKAAQKLVASYEARKRARKEAQAKARAEAKAKAKAKKKAQDATEEAGQGAGVGARQGGDEP